MTRRLEREAGRSGSPGRCLPGVGSTSAPTRGSLTKELGNGRMRLRPCVRELQGDDDIDAKRSRPSIGKTRKVPREERTRVFGWDPISGSHQGQRPKWLHLKAGYMAAPERFAETSDSSCTAGAVHIWHFSDLTGPAGHVRS